MTFFLGVIVGAMIGVLMVGMLGANGYDDGYRQAMKDANDESMQNLHK